MVTKQRTLVEQCGALQDGCVPAGVKPFKISEKIGKGASPVCGVFQLGSRLAATPQKVGGVLRIQASDLRLGLKRNFFIELVFVDCRQLDVVQSV